jgi:subtilisin family serine protease
MAQPAPSPVPTAIYQSGGDLEGPVGNDNSQNFFEYAQKQNLFSLQKALKAIHPDQDVSGSIKTFDSNAYLFAVKGLSEAGVQELQKRISGVTISRKVGQAAFSLIGGGIEGQVVSNDAIGKFINPQQLGLRNLGKAKVTDWDGTVYRAQSGVDIRAVTGWGVDSLTGASLGGARVVAAVIDDGFNFTNAEYLPNLYKNGREVPCNGKDDDSNGFIDDYQGWDSVLGHGCVSRGALKETVESEAKQGHGTHVASIMAAAIPTVPAAANPGAPTQGAIGVAPLVSLLPIKAFKDDLGAYDSESLVEAYGYLLALKRQGVKVVVVNTSYTTSCEFMTDVERKELEALVNAGITVVGAAGNDARSNDAMPMCPGNLGVDQRNPYGVKGVLSIANAAPGPAAANVFATTPSLHPWSNFGKRFVNTAAPGTVVYANKEFRSGTSMAAPHVSGIVALMYSVNPFITPSQVEEILSQSSTATNFGFPVMSQGLIHAEMAIKLAAYSVVSGTVRYQGAPVEKAVVTMNAGGIAVKSLSDTKGNFFFKRPPPGTPLEISVEKQNIFFETQNEQNAKNTRPPRLVFNGEKGDSMGPAGRGARRLGDR